jgi:hypothetical protein
MCGHGQPYVPTHVATLDELSERVLRRNKSAMNANSEAVRALCDALREAKLQIEYLHGKFQENVTGNTVITRIDAAIATYGGDGE